MTSDLYRFLNMDVIIDSNNEALRENLISSYGGFYLGSVETGAGSVRQNVHVLQIKDTIQENGQLSIEDVNQTFILKCRDLWNFDYGFYGEQQGFHAPDPLSFCKWAVIRAVALANSDLLLVHAGALERQGHAIVLPAETGMGKSTLTLKLLERGFRFLSDEVACIEWGNGWVHPFPREIHVNGKSLELLGKDLSTDEFRRLEESDEEEWAIAIDEWTPGSLSDSGGSLSKVFFLAGFGDTPRLDPVPVLRALMHLMKFSFRSLNDPAARIFELGPVFENAEYYRVVAGSLDQTAELIEEVCQQ